MRGKVVLAGLVLLGLGLPAVADEYKVSELRAIGEGRGLYLANCSSCHGPLVAGSAKETAMVAPDLGLIVVRNGSFDRVHIGASIHWGVAAHSELRSDVRMPEWGRILRARHFGDEGKTAIQVYKLVRYLEFAQLPE